ncbi:hypothetical protein CYD26_05355 [Pseudomonas sp. FFUP_PS_473]|uniref:VOC family protein n=1 Tax=Pseudomonas sp. FFUP_PS_473 TaxID=2060418 RepID=UPI000C7D439B|nr:VOC family protein [Pseudomonas sp. FFUP_PS_473]PLP95279.1 hypothetical protein CYD26_05355 [Pseudomonas sp. FFUP_PS_473]
MSEIAKNLIGRKFDQICFVVPDLEAAMRMWSETNGVAVWNVAEGLAREQIEKEYRGQPGDFQFSCAYGFAGDTLIELARHDGGNSLYKDWIDSRGYGPHHIGFRQASAEEYALAEQHYRDLGIEKAMAGFFQGPFGNCRWSYWDTREQIGFYTELYYVDGELNERMAALRRGENVSITS